MGTDRHCVARLTTRLTTRLRTRESLRAIVVLGLLTTATIPSASAQSAGAQSAAKSAAAKSAAAKAGTTKSPRVTTPAPAPAIDGERNELLSTPTAAPPTASGKQTPTPARTAPMVRLVGQGPIVTEDGALRLDLAVESATGRPLPSGLGVAVTVHRRARTRAQFQSTLRGGDLGAVIGLIPPALIPGDGRTEQLVPIDLRFGPREAECPQCIAMESNGVYPVNVELRDLSTDDVVDRFTTHIIRARSTATPPNRLKVGVIVPLHLPPAIDGPQRLVMTRASVERIEAMAGRPLVPLTVAPTPESIEALARQNDTSLLDQFRSSLAGREILGSTYVRWATSTWEYPSLDNERRRQETLGGAILRDRLSTEPVTGVLIAGDDLPSADALNRGRINVVVAQSSDLRTTGPTVSAAGGPVLFDAGATSGTPTPTRTALLLDSAIEEELSRPRDPSRRGGEDVLRAQHVLADLAMLASTTTLSSGLAIQIPENTSQATLDALLAGLGTTNPIVEPVTLSDLAKLPLQRRRNNAVIIMEPRSKSASPTNVASDAAFTAASKDADEAMTAADANAVSTLRRRLEGYASLFVDQAPNLGPASRRVARTVSADLSASDRRTLVARSSRELDRLLSQVRLSQPDQITVTARQAKVPIGVINTTGRHIRVKIAVRSSSVRLRDSGVVVDAIGTTELRQTIDVPGRVGQADVDIETRGPGSFSYVARMTTEDDLPLSSARYRLRSTAISGTGTALTAGSLVVLLAWWIRWGRKARRQPSRHHPAAANRSSATRFRRRWSASTREEDKTLR